MHVPQPPISGCANLAGDADEEAELISFVQEYKNACRQGRVAGMKDDDSPMPERIQAWTTALEQASAAFRRLVDSLPTE